MNRKNNRIGIGIIGIGGVAKQHLRSIKLCEDQEIGKLIAAVIRNHEKCKEEEKLLKSGGIRIYRNYAEMLKKEKNKINLVVIPCGIDQHAELSINSLNSGFHVLCEKPVAGTIEEALRMREARDLSRKILAIGYQDIFSPSIQRIKKLSLEKKLGRLIKAKTIALWPRDSNYYTRNNWAGKMRVGEKMIYDSPAQNGLAHFLNNMLYVAGCSPHLSALPVEIYGENYRAKDIESADTQYLKLKTAEGVEMYFIASHASVSVKDPVTEYCYENGKILWTYSGKTEIYYREKNQFKLVDSFDNDGIDIFHQIFVNIIESIQKHQAPLCTIDNALPHIICINKLFESSKGVVHIGKEFTKKINSGKKRQREKSAEKEACDVAITGLEDMVERMFVSNSGFFEIGAAWAVKGKTVYCNNILKDII